MSLTGLSKFKEGVSKLQELLSLRKGIKLHLREVTMDLSGGNEHAIGVFISDSNNKQLGWIPRETISEVQRMGRMEDLKISLINFKKKDIAMHFSKVDCIIKISSAELQFVSFPVFFLFSVFFFVLAVAKHWHRL